MILSLLTLELILDLILPLILTKSMSFPLFINFRNFRILTLTPSPFKYLLPSLFPPPSPPFPPLSPPPLVFPLPPLPPFLFLSSTPFFFASLSISLPLGLSPPFPILPIASQSTPLFIFPFPTPFKGLFLPYSKE